MIVLICQIPGKYLSAAHYSQISRPTGIWDYPPGFSAINIYNSIRTRFICWKHDAALIWVIFTSHYASIDQISWMWCELIKVARFTNWLFWNKNCFDRVDADPSFRWLEKCNALQSYQVRAVTFCGSRVLEQRWKIKGAERPFWFGKW